MSDTTSQIIEILDLLDDAFDPWNVHPNSVPGDGPGCIEATSVSLSPCATAPGMVGLGYGGGICPPASIEEHTMADYIETPHEGYQAMRMTEAFIQHLAPSEEVARLVADDRIYLVLVQGNAWVATYVDIDVDASGSWLGVGTYAHIYTAATADDTGASAARAWASAIRTATEQAENHLRESVGLESTHLISI